MDETQSGDAAAEQDPVEPEPEAATAEEEADPLDPDLGDPAEPDEDSA